MNDQSLFDFHLENRKHIPRFLRPLIPVPVEEYEVFEEKRGKRSRRSVSPRSGNIRAKIEELDSENM